MPSIINATTTNGVAISPDNSGSLQLATNNGTTAVTIDTSQNVGIGLTPPVGSGNYRSLNVGAAFMYGNTGLAVASYNNNADINDKYIINGFASSYTQSSGNHIWYGASSGTAGNAISFTERMRIDSSGLLLVGTTNTNPVGADVAGVVLHPAGRSCFSRMGGEILGLNRGTDDGTLMSFAQAGNTEGSISVSGTTVSYNGGHLSRWSQWQNQTGKPDVYRGTVLESTNEMCEWNQPNEQSTKTIVSTTAKSKAVAGVFDMYDTDDEDNPYDFYVAQSGDFVIRIAQNVVVENGDLLESAGDGTAKPQTDDICRSSTIAKVTSNYVSVTYADGSYCVPCILMIG